jgi:hypothetical protein
VAVCHNGPVVYTQTTRSLMEIGWGDRVSRAKDATGFTEIAFHWAHNWPRVDALRDSTAVLAMQEGFSHILFLDADMVWPSDVLLRMLAHHDKGIVSGLYVMRHPPYAPVALLRGTVPDGSGVTQYEHDNDARMSTPGLREQDVVGMGCALVPVSVFSAIGPRPWFHYQDDDQGWPRVTEDVPFCQKAKAAGYRVWLDPTVSCGHAVVDIVDMRWHHRYQESQAASEGRASMSLITEPVHG